VPLTQYEIASRLSYAFWGSMPDDALFAAADANQLKTNDQIVQQARRLWASPRSKPVMEQFYVEWLDLDLLPSTDKDPKAYPDFGTLKDAMGRETLAFVNYVLRDGDGRLSTLLTAPVTFANAALAKLYGVTGVTGTDLTRVDLDPNRRAGILTQLSLLSVTAHTDLNAPIYRGKMIREKFLCQTLPTPPADVPPLPPRDPSSTIRQQLAQHRSAAICNACHTLMDPIGFGFDSYDGMGGWRTMVGQFPVDNGGELTETRDIDGTFHGAPELARKLAGSDEARECMTAMSFRYMFGRATSTEDACSMGVANKLFASANYDLRELLIALVQTDAFQYRTAGGAQ
jgi:hypothetical protein